MGGPQFIPALNGLRAIAALAVFQEHAAENGLLPKAFTDTNAGALGVMLFFSLSGFLMAELYLRQDASRASVWHFVRARFARIFPLFAAVVIGSALIYHFDHRFPFCLDAFEATKHLFLLGDGHTLWTISTEFQFYATFVALWLLYAALPRGWRDIGLALICIGLALVLRERIAITHGNFFLGIAITHYGHFFLAGVLAAMVLWYAPPDRIGRTASYALPILLGLDVWVSFVLGHSDIYRSLPLLILSGTIVIAAAGGKGFFAERVLGSRVMVYLGEVSFGLYLLHRPVMYLWQTLIGLHLNWAVMFLIITATLLALSHLAYCWIEQPSRRTLSRYRAAFPGRPMYEKA